jgi:hypothetical protein
MVRRTYNATEFQFPSLVHGSIQRFWRTPVSRVNDIHFTTRLIPCTLNATGLKADGAVRLQP